MADMPNGEYDLAGLKHISLRDWFAGAGPRRDSGEFPQPPKGSGEPFDQFAVRVTETAYGFADAMLKRGEALKQESRPAW